MFNESFYDRLDELSHDGIMLIFGEAFETYQELPDDQAAWFADDDFSITSLKG